MTPTTKKFECPNCGNMEALQFGGNGRCDKCKEAFTWDESQGVWVLDPDGYKEPEKAAEPEKEEVQQSEPEQPESTVDLPEKKTGIFSRVNKTFKEWGEEFIG